MARKNITNITQEDARLHIQRSKKRSSLYCENIAGFFLLNQGGRGAWCYRYKNTENKRRVMTIGAYPALSPIDAAMIAMEWRARDADPLQERSEGKQKKLQAANDALRVVTESEKRTLRAYLAGGYARHISGWPDKSKAALAWLFRTAFSDFLDRDMSTLTKLDINLWQEKMEKVVTRRGEPLSHSTIRRDFSALRALLNTAVDYDLLTVNPINGHRLRPPARAVKRSAAEREKQNRRMLTGNEMGGILAGLDKFGEEIRRQRRSSRHHGKAYLPDLDAVAYPHWFIPFCRLAMATGWRPGDLYALEWGHIYLGSRIQKVAEKSREISERRGKEGTLLDVTLPESAKKMLADWKKQQGNPSSGLVFPSPRPSPRTGNQLDASSHKKPWAQVKELAGIDPALHFYSLRHHAISAMVANGVPMLTVARMVGHRDTGMIERHYGHLCPVSAAHAMDVIDATIRQAEKSRGAL